MDRKLKIMIIDDEVIVGNRLKSSLEKIGHQVDIFTDSSKAKELLERERYDIIVSDLKMPRVDGMQILQCAKSVRPDSIVILISGFGTHETAKEAIKMGAYEFVIKPFKISQLREIINNAAQKTGRPEPK